MSDTIVILNSDRRRSQMNMIDFAVESPMTYAHIRRAVRDGTLTAQLAALPARARIAVAAEYAMARMCTITHALQVFGDVAELRESGLRPANHDEAGWFAVLVDGRRVWASDVFESDGYANH